MSPLLSYVLRRPSRRRLQVLRTYLALRGSEHFDADFYRSAHPDAAAAGDPLLHYLDRGWRSGYDPSGHFSTSEYLARRPEIAREGINPLLHFVLSERAAREGRGARRIARSVLRRARWLVRRLGPESRIVRKEGSASALVARRLGGASPGGRAAGALEADITHVPVDRRGVLLRPGERPGREPSVDVVVCVHDAPADLERCLASLIEKTGRPFHLILVDDGSGQETKMLLRRFMDANPAATLITRKGPPHGYTLAANEGVRASTGDYVVLLNSDTIVTLSWLERLLACGESDPAIGLVGPLSNAASHQSVPELREGGAWAVNELPPFLTADGLARLLACAAAPEYPRLPFLNGFCYAVKRQVIDAIGLFDEERFASGYCEENDYSYRASMAGFELAVADDAYVLHAKSRSYGTEGRREVAQRNYEIFLDKHGRKNIEPLVAELDRGERLADVRHRVSRALADAEWFAAAFRAECPDPLRVGFVVHSLGNEAAGGVHSIYQEVRGMRALGVDARILLPETGLINARRRYADAEEVFSGFGDLGDLGARAGDLDVAVATHFLSVELVREMLDRREGLLPAYYVQDYEPFFFDEGSREFEQALASYTALPDPLVFAKTRWLCALVEERHGLPVAKVEPSLDHSVFRPAGRGARRGEWGRRGPVRVVGMVRPRTPRRQPHGTLRILDRVQEELGDAVTVAAFGCEPKEYGLVSPRRAGHVDNLGLLTREEVAGVLSGADVFLDFSTYQAFGRTALEAMACGCVPVLPRMGGTDEFAVDGHNARVVDTRSEGEAFDAIAELVRDRARLRRMREAGLETAGRFSIPRAALSEYALFADAHARRASRGQRSAPAA